MDLRDLNHKLKEILDITTKLLILGGLLAIIISCIWVLLAS
jgi:hypothetical protein